MRFVGSDIQWDEKLGIEDQEWPVTHKEPQFCCVCSATFRYRQGQVSLVQDKRRE